MSMNVGQAGGQQMNHIPDQGPQPQSFSPPQQVFPQQQGFHPQQGFAPSQQNFPPQLGVPMLMPMYGPGFAQPPHMMHLFEAMNASRQAAFETKQAGLELGRKVTALNPKVQGMDRSLKEVQATIVHLQEGISVLQQGITQTQDVQPRLLSMEAKVKDLLDNAVSHNEDIDSLQMALELEKSKTASVEARCVQLEYVNALQEQAIKQLMERMARIELWMPHKTYEDGILQPASASHTSPSASVVSLSDPIWTPQRDEK